MGGLAAAAENGVRVKKRNKLENVSIANALQLEAARRRAVPIRFYTLPVASLKSISLSVAVFTVDTPRSAVILNFDPVILTKLIEIGQYAAELLRFEYLTL